jgi:hypothetical protein
MPHGTPAALHAAKEREEAMNGELTYAPTAPLPRGDHEVFIFNIGSMRHEVAKGSVGTFVIPACEPGEGISEPLVIPGYVHDSYFVEQEMRTHSVTGEFMAQDIVHPQIGASWSFGQNLDDLGVFWTVNNPPKPEEIAAARAKMEVTYRKLLQAATDLETTGRLQDITPLMRIAASYFGEDRPWNRIYKKVLECPGCGEPAKPGIIRHPCGFIFDPDRALVAGMITKETHATMMAALDGATKPARGRKNPAST